MAMLVAIWFILGVASGSREREQQAAAVSPPYYKKWRRDPKMVVFGDSISDVGRRFNAPASFDYEDIGPFPWTNLFAESDDSDSEFKAYLPSRGSVTNGRVWPTYLLVPDELNFATSSASASDAFRSRERCTGYTGEYENLPTGTLREQVFRYEKDVLEVTDATLDHTHIILIGSNEPFRLFDAFTRYSVGGDGYQDPVDFDMVFKTVDGKPEITFEPMVREIIGAWKAAIARLIKRGVTGRILLASLPSARGIPDVIDTGLADTLDLVSLQLRAAAEEIAQANRQVRVLDIYALSAALVDKPEIFEDLGFTASPGGSLGTPCLDFHFTIDEQSEIMGTRGDRAAGCRDECAFCADGSSPCQNCLKGYPSATVCEDPDRRIFWDPQHFTTEVHHILAEAIRQCSKSSPNYGRAWVEQLCP